MTGPSDPAQIGANELRAKILNANIVLREVGLREGLQAQPLVVPTETKAQWMVRLVAAGFNEVNPVSFVRSDVMPQMADAETFLDQVTESLPANVRVSGLSPNQKGVDRAIAAHRRGQLSDAILVTAATASTLSANGMTANIDQRISEVAHWAEACKSAGLGVIVFISAAFGCSIEGRVPPEAVIRIAGKLKETASVDEIVLSDSTGQGDPLQVHELLSRLARELPKEERLGLHFHDSRGAGLANILAAMMSPFTSVVIDTAFGGWGGDIPFIPEAAGNVASEDVAEMLIGMGHDVAIDVSAVAEVTKEALSLLGVPLRSRVAETGIVRWKPRQSRR
jgi:isopropylmalate/homocitrate/citramalate synthase